MNNYYKHYFKQAHKLLTSSDENLFTTFLFNSVKKKCIIKKFLWENEHASPHIVLHNNVHRFITNNTYFVENTLCTSKYTTVNIC